MYILLTQDKPEVNADKIEKTRQNAKIYGIFGEFSTLISVYFVGGGYMQELFSFVMLLIIMLLAEETPLSALSSVFTIIMFVDWLIDKLNDTKKK